VHSPPIPDTSPFAECSRPGNFEQLISIFINIIFFWSIISQQKNSNKGTRRHFGFRIIYYSFERKSLGKRLNAGFRLNACIPAVVAAAVAAATSRIHSRNDRIAGCGLSEL